MIAKCKAISHGGAMLQYAMREDKMERIVLLNLLSGTTPEEVLSEFEAVNGYNSRCKNKYLRFEIGIAPGDRAKLKPGDLKEIAHRFAKKMGLENHQYIAVAHKDTDNLHIHLIANRIGIDGKVYDTAFVSNRSAKAAEEISREMGLTIAKEVQAKREHVARGLKEHSARAQKKCAAYFGPERLAAWGLDQDRLTVRAELQKLAYESLRNSKNPNDFANDLRRKGVRVVPMKNKQKRIYGLRFVYKGEEFKASDIGREFGLHSLYNYYGLRLSHQKGNPFVPKHYVNPLSILKDAGKTVLSAAGDIVSAAAEGASVVGGLFDAASSNSTYNPAEAEFRGQEALRKKKKKRGMRI